MPSLKLTYYDMHGGRGEVARMALHIGKVAHEDVRIPFSELAALKPKLPYAAIPTLEVDGKVLAQSNGINRYTGKLAGLYPTDALEAAFCDEVMDAVEDVAAKVVPTFSITDAEERKRARQALVDGPLSYYLTAIARRLEERGGEWFADGRLTVADLKVFLWVRHLRSGKLEHVPADLPDRVAPALVAHFERVKSHPDVQAYYAWRGVQP